MLKKILIFVLITILFAVPLISAVEFSMKENFKQGETLMARISGNFLEPILWENIFLYRGHVRIPLEPYVTNIEGDYYIYSQLLGKAPNNYSLSIENVKYMKGAKISEEPIVKNFSISNITADFFHIVLDGSEEPLRFQNYIWYFPNSIFSAFSFLTS